MNETVHPSPEAEICRDKAVRLFTYLKELCALRASQVRNVASYDQVFWLNDLPRHKLCRSILWRLVDPALAITEPQSEPWIEIRKPSLKSPPELPDDLEPWIKEQELNDSSLSEPGVYDQISRIALQGDVDGRDPNALVSISEGPKVFDKWVDYVEAQWKPWAAEDRELQKIQRAYNQLFNSYQRQEKLGEQYEVIVGAGLLAWRSPNSGEIKRHVLAIQARIEFDRIRGIMSVRPALDGPPPALEYGMLDTADRPNPTDLTGIENDVQAFDGDPWESVGLESVLRGFANSLPTAGDYIATFDHSGSLTDRPTVRLSPALILRKRTRRTFEDFISRSLNRLKKARSCPKTSSESSTLLKMYRVMPSLAVKQAARAGTRQPAPTRNSIFRYPRTKSRSESLASLSDVPVCLFKARRAPASRIRLRI